MRRLFIWMVLFVPSITYAQSPLEVEAALDLARYCVNEAGFDKPGDCLLLWQAAETHADTLRGRLTWLRQHSQCVLEESPRMLPGNCRWARNLQWSDIRPIGWPSGVAWVPERWSERKEQALRIVQGIDTERPCLGEPSTWDGRRWMQSAIDRGWEPLHCRCPYTGEPTENEGYVWRGVRQGRLRVRVRGKHW